MTTVLQIIHYFSVTNTHKFVVKLGSGSCAPGYWSAGQRVDVTRLTPFVWKPKTLNGYQQLPMSYTNWITGQPDNIGGSSNKINEDCLNVYYSEQQPYFQWNDIRCSRPLCYICEYDI